MLLGTQGTIDATMIALKKKWAINLSGGYHHAKRTHGSGFCIYPDIIMALKQAKKLGIKKPIILDLDAHQGNGY